MLENEAKSAAHFCVGIVQPWESKYTAQASRLVTSKPYARLTMVQLLFIDTKKSALRL